MYMHVSLRTRGALAAVPTPLASSCSVMGKPGKPSAATIRAEPAHAHVVDSTTPPVRTPPARGGGSLALAGGDAHLRCAHARATRIAVALAPLGRSATPRGEGAHRPVECRRCRRLQPTGSLPQLRRRQRRCDRHLWLDSRRRDYRLRRGASARSALREQWCAWPRSRRRSLAARDGFRDAGPTGRLQASAECLGCHLDQHKVEQHSRRYLRHRIQYQGDGHRRLVRLQEVQALVGIRHGEDCERGVRQGPFGERRRRFAPASSRPVRCMPLPPSSLPDTLTPGPPACPPSPAGHPQGHDQPHGLGDDSAQAADAVAARAEQPAHHEAATVDIDAARRLPAAQGATSPDQDEGEADVALPSCRVSAPLFVAWLAVVGLYRHLPYQREEGLPTDHCKSLVISTRRLKCET